MQIVLTALHRACQSSALRFHRNALRGLQRRDALQSLSIPCNRQAVLPLAVSVGLGACIIAALGPVPALAEAAQGTPTPVLASVPDVTAPTRGADPLEAFRPVEEPEILTYAQLQDLFITSVPLTDSPATAGDAANDVDVRATEYIEFENMRVPVWIVDTILRASEATGADPVYMMALADKESSFIPGNKATTSSAVGLFQFISSTWLEAVRSFGPKHGLLMEAASIGSQDGKLTVSDDTKREYILGLRRNPYISALMAAEMMKRDKAKIEARLGRQLSRSEFYLSHFFGADSASKFIALVDDTPKKSAQSAFPSAAKSNKSLFYTKDGKKTRELTVSEVYSKIDTMIDKRLNRYGDVSSRMTAEAGL